MFIDVYQVGLSALHLHHRLEIQQMWLSDSWHLIGIQCSPSLNHWDVFRVSGEVKSILTDFILVQGFSVVLLCFSAWSAAGREPWKTGTNSTLGVLANFRNIWSHAHTWSRSNCAMGWSGRAWPGLGAGVTLNSLEMNLVNSDCYWFLSWKQEWDLAQDEIAALLYFLSWKVALFEQSSCREVIQSQQCFNFTPVYHTLSLQSVM